MSRFFAIEGAPAYVKARRLYERLAVTDLWDKLTIVSKQQWKWNNIPNKEDPSFQASQPRLLQIRGPPGSGKSSATFYWVSSSITQLRNISALWISCGTINGKTWSLAFESESNRCQATETSSPLSSDDAESAHIVVFDGIRAATLETWRALMMEMARNGIVVIFVSSEGVFFHSGDSQDILKLEHFMPSWTMSEYKEACRDDQFWASCCTFFETSAENDNIPSRESLLDQKFQVAGHSARFMFRNYTAEIKRDIEGLARAMDGFDSLEQATRSDRSIGAVNTIVARLCSEKNGATPHRQAIFPVQQDIAKVPTSGSDIAYLSEESDRGTSSPSLLSSYATAEVLKILPTDIERVRKVGRALGSQAIEGYALGLQLRKSLKEAKKTGRSLSLSGGDTSLPVSSVKFCDMDNLAEVLGEQKPLNTWIFVAGRQGCFDAIHLVSDTHIRILQLTAGERHSFKLYLLDSLLRELAQKGVTWTHVEFMILRPADDFRRFTLDPAQGSLQNYTRLDGEEWNQVDYRQNVQYATLDWD